MRMCAECGGRMGLVCEVGAGRKMAQASDGLFSKTQAPRYPLNSLTFDATHRGRAVLRPLSLFSVCVFLPKMLGAGEEGSSADVTFVVEGIPVPAHRALVMRCAYFKALLGGAFGEASQQEISLPHVRHPIFMVLLEYLCV